MFFAYNNGVSATAMDVQLERTVGGTHIVGARDFQIINGGQTTASLSNTRHKDKADLEGIYVQMKLTEIDESDTDRSTELVRNISRSSNSQNKVTDAKSLTKCRVDTRVNDSLRSLIEHYPRVSTFNKRKRNVLCTKLWTCLQEQEA